MFFFLRSCNKWTKKAVVYADRANTRLGSPVAGLKIRIGQRTIGTLRSNDADDNENVKKTIGLISKTTTSHVHHTFLYISFLFLHDYDVKMPNFAFYGGRKQAMQQRNFISLSEPEFGQLQFSFRRVRLQLTK